MYPGYLLHTPVKRGVEIFEPAIENPKWDKKNKNKNLNRSYQSQEITQNIFASAVRLEKKMISHIKASYHNSKVKAFPSRKILLCPHLYLSVFIAYIYVCFCIHKFLLNCSTFLCCNFIKCLKWKCCICLHDLSVWSTVPKNNLVFL